MAARRVTLREAADILGLSKEAVRKRVIRGTLQSDMGADGRRHVYLDVGGDESPTHEGGTLISEMRARIQFLEEEHRRKDAILLNMTEAMKALSPPERESPESEASPAPSRTLPPPGRDSGGRAGTREKKVVGVLALMVSIPDRAVAIVRTGAGFHNSREVRR